MINSCKSTKKINSFEFTLIPSPRDVFNKYGLRNSLSGEFSCDSTGGSPAMVSSSSTIDQIINASVLLDSSVGV